jgi:hypothetical protein
MQTPIVTELRRTPSDTQKAWHLRQVRLVRESLLYGRVGDKKR